jgi:hypothetical protein
LNAGSRSERDRHFFAAIGALAIPPELMAGAVAAAVTAAVVTLLGRRISLAARRLQGVLRGASKRATVVRIGPMGA